MSRSHCSEKAPALSPDAQKKDYPIGNEPRLKVAQKLDTNKSGFAEAYTKEPGSVENANPAPFIAAAPGFQIGPKAVKINTGSPV